MSWELQRKKNAEIKLKKEELERRQNAELNDFKLLLKKVERWQHLKLIRGYIHELETKSLENGELEKDINDWIVLTP